MVTLHGRKWLNLLLFYAVFVERPTLAATRSVTILSDASCGVNKGDDVHVCGARIVREDVRRLHELAACIIKNQAASSSAAVTAYIRVGDVSRFRSVFASDQSCSSRGLRVSAAMLAGAFAEALLDRPMLARLAKGEGGGGPASSAFIPTDALLHCMMRTGRSEAATFIRSLPYTREERSAATTVGDKLRDCTPAGTTVRASLPLLRSLTALTFFAERLPPVERTGPPIERTPIERGTETTTSLAIQPPIVDISSSALLQAPSLSIQRIDDTADGSSLGARPY
jgi:hypothetical protein